MQYISSDTNVWLDFLAIDCLHYPFLLPFVYLMNEDAIDDELLSPKELKTSLIHLGLKSTELTIDEFYLAEEFRVKYKKLSRYDCIALSIAAIRKIPLMTGDKALRNAAAQEKVEVIGTIFILDKCFELNCIDASEYENVLKILLQYNGGKIRLPEKELLVRLESIQKCK